MLNPFTFHHREEMSVQTLASIICSSTAVVMLWALKTLTSLIRQGYKQKASAENLTDGR